MTLEVTRPNNDYVDTTCVATGTKPNTHQVNVNDSIFFGNFEEIVTRDQIKQKEMKTPGVPRN